MLSYAQKLSNQIKKAIGLFEIKRFTFKATLRNASFVKNVIPPPNKLVPNTIVLAKEGRRISSVLSLSPKKRNVAALSSTKIQQLRVRKTDGILLSMI